MMKQSILFSDNTLGYDSESSSDNSVQILNQFRSMSPQSVAHEANEMRKQLSHQISELSKTSSTLHSKQNSEISNTDSLKTLIDAPQHTYETYETEAPNYGLQDYISYGLNSIQKKCNILRATAEVINFYQYPTFENAKKIAIPLFETGLNIYADSIFGLSGFALMTAVKAVQFMQSSSSDAGYYTVINFVAHVLIPAFIPQSLTPTFKMTHEILTTAYSIYKASSSVYKVLESNLGEDSSCYAHKSGNTWFKLATYYYYDLPKPSENATFIEHFIYNKKKEFGSKYYHLRSLYNTVKPKDIIVDKITRKTLGTCIDTEPMFDMHDVFGKIYEYFTIENIE